MPYDTGILLLSMEFREDHVQPYKDTNFDKNVQSSLVHISSKLKTTNVYQQQKGFKNGSMFI